MSSIYIELPDHKEVLDWIQEKEVTDDQLDEITKKVGLSAEEQMKIVLTPHTRTGFTRASVQTRLLSKSKGEVSYGVGSWSRGHILYWLDRGRGFVYPKQRLALMWITRAGEKIFRAWAGIAPAFDIMRQSAVHAYNRINEIVEETLK